jgi:hypothetical protein
MEIKLAFKGLKSYQPFSLALRTLSHSTCQTARCHPARPICQTARCHPASPICQTARCHSARRICQTARCHSATRSVRPLAVTQPPNLSDRSLSLSHPICQTARCNSATRSVRPLAVTQPPDLSDRSLSLSAAQNSAGFFAIHKLKMSLSAVREGCCNLCFRFSQNNPSRV